MLPRPRALPLVAAEGVEAAGERSGAARGPQPHIGLVQHALGGRGCTAATSRCVRRAKYCVTARGFSPSDSSAAPATSYIRMKSRSDDAVISRLAILPKAKRPTRAPGTRP